MEPVTVGSGSGGADLPVTVTDGRPALVEVSGVGDRGDLVGWLAEHRAAIEAALHRYGGLMLRGLPVREMADFAAARDTLIRRPTVYREKATPRTDLGDGVMSSTDFPPEQPIDLHNENSYTLEFPALLLFGCLVPPAQGGGTTVADCREVLSYLPAGLVERFAATGWMLRRRYQPHMSLPWATAFGTDDPAAVEKYCRDNLIAWRWLPPDGLLTSQLRPALIRHPETGERVWFNHIAFWNEHSLDPDIREVLMSSYGPDGLPFQTRYGDGTPVPADEARALNDAYARARRCEPWRRGDLLLVDNLLACHGREPYAGERRIVVAMGDPVRLVDCAPDPPPAPGLLDD